MWRVIFEVNTKVVYSEFGESDFKSGGSALVTVTAEIVTV